MNWQDLSDEIVSVLTTLQLDSSSAFVDVFDYPSTAFTGLPSAMVLPDNVDSDYATTSTNQRSYSFNIYLYITSTSDSMNQADLSAAFDKMRALTDVTLGAFDRTYNLNGKCDFLKPSTMKWQRQMTDIGEALVLPINLVCVGEFDWRS